MHIATRQMYVATGWMYIATRQLYDLMSDKYITGGMPEAKDGFFTTYYAFNQIVLDVLMEKFNIQVDEDTVTQSTLLHSDIPSYDLPAINFMSPSEEAQESHILKEQDTMINTHLEKVLVHMIDEQDAKIFKSHNDNVQNKRKFISLYAAFLCDILLTVTFIAFFLKDCKTIWLCLQPL